MRAKVLIIALLFFAVSLSADDRTVLFDKGVDFSTLKTLAVHDLKIDSIRPEVKNTLVGDHCSRGFCGRVAPAWTSREPAPDGRSSAFSAVRF